jgi:adenylate cyclase
MSDIRGYSTIAERTNPSALAGKLNRHRAEMNSGARPQRHSHAVRR